MHNLSLKKSNDNEDCVDNKDCVDNEESQYVSYVIKKPCLLIQLTSILCYGVLVEGGGVAANLV